MTVEVTRTGDIALVTIDNPPVNALSQAVRTGLLEALWATEADVSVRAVVLRCAGRTFVAGGDVTEFDKPPLEPHLPDVIFAIEAAQKPWIAALHGTALGGGLELAMGCHVRIADAATRLGLPEVTLGLIPGAGGTVRLPRLVGAELALKMIAGGKPIQAAEACEAGLINEIAEGDLLDAACALAGRMPGPVRTLARAGKIAKDSPDFAASATAFRVKARGQVSVIAAIEAVERACDLPVAKAMDAERACFLDLKASDQSVALRRLFFAERNTLKQDARVRGQARPVQTIGVVGGGTMGVGIASACLRRGLSVTLIEQSQEAAHMADSRVEDTLAVSAKRGVITDAENARSLLSTSTKMSDLNSADIVIEAVFEDMDVKKSVFRDLDQVTRADAVLATNTSYLDVNEIAAVLRDPSRAIGLHFFSPAHIMKLVEIVVPDQVADDVVATAASLSKTLGKIGVLAGVCDGFIGNRIMSAYRQEADFLLEDGATPYDVDAALRSFGFAMGVFEMQDLAGLDIAWAKRKRQAATRDPAKRYVRIADRLCEAGRFGRKTQAGWYDYSETKAHPSALVASIIDEERKAKGLDPQALSAAEILARLRNRMANEAKAVLSEGIATSAEDIDVVMVNGYGYPRWQGSVIPAAST